MGCGMVAMLDDEKVEEKVVMMVLLEAESSAAYLVVQTVGYLALP